MLNPFQPDLSVEKLIREAHKDALKGISDTINKHLAELRRHGVRIMSKPYDEPYQELARTLEEQKRERQALLNNDKLTQAQRDKLRQDFPDQNTHYIDQIIRLDKHLDEMNVALATPFLYPENTNVLMLSNRGLTRLPETLITLISYHFPALRVFFLDGNQLSVLPDKIDKLSSLLWLKVDSNQLYTLPATLSNLALTQLGMRGNLFNTLPNNLETILERTHNEEYLPLLRDPTTSVTPPQRRNSLASICSDSSNEPLLVTTSWGSLNLFTASLEELIRYAQKSATCNDKDLSDNLNKMIEGHLATLRSYQVSFTITPGDQPYQILDKKLKEQQREKAALLQNRTVTDDHKAALNTADPMQSQESHSLDQVVRLDKVLNTINMELALPYLPAEGSQTQKISLNYCGLTRLPEALITKLMGYCGLTSLFIAHNQLSTLPEALGKATKLRIVGKESNPHLVLPAAIVSARTLSVNELILQANQALRDPRAQDKYLKLNKMIEKQLQDLQHTVRIISLPEDPPFKVLERTVSEQQREKALLLQNEHVSADWKAALKTADPECTQHARTFKDLIALDKVLNAVNMALAAPHLPNDRNLRVIFLDDCGLTRFPEALINQLKNYSNLFSLRASTNHLVSLPESISKLSFLHEFIIYNNPLISLPAALCNFKFLARFGLNCKTSVNLPASLRAVLVKTHNEKYANLIPPVRSRAPHFPSLTYAFSRLSMVSFEVCTSNYTAQPQNQEELKHASPPSVGCVRSVHTLNR